MSDLNSTISPLRISCSSLFRYRICPSAILHEQEFIQKETTKYALDGIEKHKEIQKAIESNTLYVDAGYAKMLSVEMTKLDPNFNFNHCLSEDKLSFEFVKRRWTRFKLVGTPDLIYFSTTDPDNQTVYIIDYKFGHVDVPVINNAQLLGYALLFREVISDRFRIKVGIFQDDVINITEVSKKDLEEFRKELFNIVENATKPTDNSDSYSPSEIACKWCNHRENCTALIDTTKKTLVTIKAKSALNRLSEEDKFDYYQDLIRHKKLVEYVLEDCEKYFKHQLQNGVFYDFLSLKSNGSISQWNDEFTQDEIIEELEKLGTNPLTDFYEKKLKSVPQIKKILGEIPASLVQLKEKAKSLKITERREGAKKDTDDLF